MHHFGYFRIIGGFEDKEGLREFLFALPKFAAAEGNPLDKKRRSRIGTIEIVRCEASYVKEEYRSVKDIQFNQATKKDAYKVTEGKYTMSTTKKGRYIQRSAPYDVQLKKLWRVGRECGRLTVNYRMGHTLKEMGVTLRPTDWSRVVVRRLSSGSGTPPASPPITPPGVACPSSPAKCHSNPSSPKLQHSPSSQSKTFSSDCLSAKIKTEVENVKPVLETALQATAVSS